MPQPPSFLCPVAAWPLIRDWLTEHHLEPWAQELAVADLRWHEDQVRRGYHRRMPGYRKLMRRWRWTETATRELMVNEGSWKVHPSAVAPQSLRSGSATSPQSDDDSGGSPDPGHRTSTAPAPRSPRTLLDTRVDPMSIDHVPEEGSRGSGGGLFPLPMADELKAAKRVFLAHQKAWLWKDKVEDLDDRWVKIHSKIPKGLDVMDQIDAMDAWLAGAKVKKGSVFWRRLQTFLTGRVAKARAAEAPKKVHRPPPPPAEPRKPAAGARPDRMNFKTNDEFRAALQAWTRQRAGARRA